MVEVKTGRVLTAARELFLRYGYKRVSMADIAEAVGISRPALYNIFKNKEDIFSGVFLRWVDETILEIENGISELSTSEDKLKYAFELWTVRPFDIVNTSPEAKELIECTFGFARSTQREGYARFEATLVPILATLAGKRTTKGAMDSETIAHILTSAALGFKQTATTKSDLRELIQGLLTLSLRNHSRP